MGSHPHVVQGIEIYKGKPVYYGLGSFSFHTGHGGKKHGDWVGMMARLEFNERAVTSATFQFVRHNDANETFFCRLADETEAVTELCARSNKLGAILAPQGDRLHIV